MLDPYFSAPKMAWLRAHVTTDGVVTTTDTWLVHQLCGAFVTDASTASRSLLLDLDGVGWDRELLELFGLADEPLPRIVACDELVGTTTAFGRAMRRRRPDRRPAGGPAGPGLLGAGAAKCTFGTGAFLLANTGSAGRALDRGADQLGGVARCASRPRTASTVRSTPRRRPCAG